MHEATILVVEDEKDMLKGITDVLEGASYAVIGAPNGAEALKRMEESVPDLVLSDIRMPIMDGLSFYRAMRKDDRWGLVPFIFLTAMGEPGEVREAKLLGVDDYIVKPFEVEDILVAIESRLLRARDVREASRRELQTLKRNMVHLLSHEMYSALQSIRGYSELAAEMGDDPDPDRLLEFLMGVRAGGGRLQKLVDDLVLIISIESGQKARDYALRKGPLRTLESLIASLLEDYQPQAAKARVKLRFEAAPDLPAVEGQRNLLADVLGRLLDNAIKFSPKKGTVDVRLFQERDFVCITVADEGPGVPLSEQPYVFDVFHQIERWRHEKGAGLGLTVARGLVQIHGGTLTLDSQPGKGATFTIKLPALEDTSA